MCVQLANVPHFLFLQLLEYVAVMLRNFFFLDILHGSIRRYNPLRSSANCGCGHLMMQSVGIAIAHQFIVIAFTQPGEVHC